MTEALRIKWDGTINLPMLVALIAAISSGAVYVNGKFNDLAMVVKESADNSRKIEVLRQEILRNRQETLENRRVYQEGEAGR